MNCYTNCVIQNYFRRYIHFFKEAIISVINPYIVKIMQNAFEFIHDKMKGINNIHLTLIWI